MTEACIQQGPLDKATQKHKELRYKQKYLPFKGKKITNLRHGYTQATPV